MVGSDLMDSLVQVVDRRMRRLMFVCLPRSLVALLIFQP